MPPLVLGHRGAPRAARENTLESFRAALDEGADGVELDAHRTADGHVVVHHDPVVPDVGIIAALARSTLAEQAPYVPDLSVVLDECRGALVNVELKVHPDDPGFDPALPGAGALVELLGERGHGDHVVVSSFHLPTVERVRALDHEVETAYLVVIEPAPKAAADVAAAAGIAGIHPWHGAMNVDVTAEAVAHAHAAGLAVRVWTVNDPAEMVRLAEAGVDAIITDVPGEARAALRG